MNRNQAIDFFNLLDKAGVKRFYDKYCDYFKNGFTVDLSERIEKSVIYPDAVNSLVVIEIRCNVDISFNDEIRNNDLLYLFRFDESDRLTSFHFDCTTDPCTTKNRIAHTARQIYRGNVGNHKAINGRTCIRSDNGSGTWVRRTDTTGEVIPLDPEHSDAELGHYGINIHDNGGFANSSLGCTILAGGNYLQPGPYRDIYKPLLLKCSNNNNIPVVLLDLEDVEDINGWIIPA